MSKQDVGEYAKLSYLPSLCTAQSLLRLVIIAQLLALVLVLNDGGLRFFSWIDLALTSLMVQWVTLASAALICQLRPLLSRLDLWLAVTCSYGLILLLTFVFSLLGQWFFLGYWWNDKPLNWFELGTDLILAAIFAGIGLQYFYLQQQLQRQQMAELEARIQALQSRIRPHFLFNAMNTIASLVAIDARRAERMVEDLAALFRASLAEPALVPVAQEVTLAKRYLAMEAARLGDRLEVSWQVDNLEPQAMIPSLLLQPLLENAIYHGIGSRRAGGLLEIAIEASNNQLQLLVRNPLGETAHESGNGMALDNIRERVAIHFGSAAHCFAGIEEEHFVVRISYPLEKS